MKNKVICIDWMIFLKMATESTVKSGMMPTYTAMTMILGNLKKIGVSPDDTILIVCDHHGSWRKDFIPKTKEDRKEIESKFQIRFPGIYQKFDNLLETLNQATDWHICKFSKIEADDWIAVATRYYGVFLGNEVVALTMDSDMQQLWKYDCFKFFSPHRAMKRYKIKPDNFNIAKHIAKLVMTKGHNNLGIPTTPEEHKVKKLCTDITHLPWWIEKTCIKRFMEIKPKVENPSLLRSKVLIERYNSLYNSPNNIVTYEGSVRLVEKRKAKKRRVKK